MIDRITKGTLALLLASALLFGCTPTEPVQPSTDSESVAGEEMSDDISTEETESSSDSNENEESENPVEDDPLVVSYHLDERLPSELRAIVLKNRERVFVTLTPELQEQFESYLTQGLTQEEDQRIAAILEACPADYQEAMETAPDTLSTEEAQEDIRFLFDYLRYYYAGYTYFGDKAVFDPIRDRLLAEVEELGDGLSNEQLETLLVDALLPVLADCHFHIGDTYFMDTYANQYFIYSDELLFEEIEDAYRTTLDGEAYRLVEVEGAEPSLLPYLTGEGRIAWVIGRYDTQPDASTAALLLSHVDTGEEQTLEITLEAADTDYLEALGNDIFHLRYEGDIPVVENRRLWGDGEEEAAQLEAMASSGADVQDAPVVIVDLRNNGGGSDMYASQWTANYAGLDDNPYYNLIVASKYNRTVLTSAKWMREQLGLTDEELSQLDPGFMSYLGDDPKIIPNENLVVVLTDQQVGSSGEGFVAILREMDNVLIVGTNTSGCKNFGDCNRVYLPKSHIEIYCGFKLFLMPDLVIDEGIGFMPDLWAPPGESLERVLQFVENYGLAA